MAKEYAELLRPSINNQQGSLATDASTVDALAPVKVIAGFVPYQSYEDSTLLEHAIKVQNAPNGILIDASNNVRFEATAGYSLGLAPWSQTPVSVRFNAGGQRGSSGVVTLKPGQVITPEGANVNGSSEAFSGFWHGGTYGWLGGGNYYLFVFRTPNATVDWTTHTEVIFHRQRVIIRDPTAALPAITTTAGTGYNWPQSFAWPNAINSNNQLNSGVPGISVKPTKVGLRILTATSATNSNLVFLARLTDQLDIGANGVTPTAAANPALIESISFPNTVLAGQATFPYVEVVGGPLSTLGGPQTRIDAVETNNTGLNGTYLDILRFGKIG